MITDYKNASDRLNKMPTLKLSKTEKVIYTLIVLWFVWYVFQAVSFIAQPQVTPVATTTEEVDYSNLKPLPQMNWNFTPINERMGTNSN